MQGSAFALQSKNTYVHAQSRVVVALGTKDLIVVETPDAVLVVNSGMTQEVRKIDSLINMKSADQGMQTSRVVRSWGWYEEIQRANGYRIKLLSVAPGCSLSMQSHQHRCEHWYVLSGQATVHLDARCCLLEKNQSIFISVAQRHQLINHGSEWLTIIETQTGTYLEEDDITRYEQ